MLHPRETVIDHAAGGGGTGEMSINVNISGARGNREIEAMVAAGVQQGLASYDRQLPGRVKGINRDPRSR